VPRAAEDPPVIARHAQKGHIMNDRKRENAGPVQATLNRWEGEGGAVPAATARDPRLEVFAAGRRPEAVSYTLIAQTLESMHGELYVPFSHETAPCSVARGRVRPTNRNRPR
jgi:hypothetical protein